jgi:UDP-4-amino-4,6-dideoxy-N-acetyl-beta-L-altrosamine transaminase
MRITIPYARQDIDSEDIAAVVKVLQSDWLTQGPSVEKFERAVADYCGAKYAVAVNSATSALHIACLAAGLSPGDSMWTSPNTFVASANCGRYCGADVDFVDIDAKTYNMSVEQLAGKLKRTSQGGKFPKVIIPVHFAGQSCEMEEIRKLSASYGITVIEDASHAIGGKYKNEPVGSCAFSDMTVFSFHPVKIITTGEGGLILTNRRDLYDRLVLFRSHGITRRAELMTEPVDGPWHYQQISLGYNYRITDFQAALGFSQLTRIDSFIKRRHEIAARYDGQLAKLPLTLPWQHPDTYSAYHLYPVVLETARTRQRVHEKLWAKGVTVGVHYIPVHTQPYYKQMGFKGKDFPAAVNYYERTISLPMFFGLNDSHQELVIDILEGILT